MQDDQLVTEKAIGSSGTLSYGPRMNWSLILDYVRALTWPSVAIFVAIFFRKQISYLLNHISEASGFGVNIKVEHDLDQLAKRGKSLPMPATPGKDKMHLMNFEVGTSRQPTARSQKRDIGPFAKTSDELLFDDWRKLEELLFRIGRQLDLPHPNYLDFHEVLKELLKRGLITNEVAIYLSDLRRTRNDLVHRADYEFFTDKATNALLVSIESAMNVLMEVESGL